MNADGSGIKRITITDTDNHGPHWSPDGEQIAYVSNLDGNYEILIIDKDGSNSYNLTNNELNDYSAVWRPVSTLNHK